MKTTVQKIVDESIFSGIHEFDGKRYESRGSGFYSVYEKRGNAHVHCAIISIAASLRGQRRLQALSIEY